MDKELALAIEFKKAPIELQNIATAHYANVKALAKAVAKELQVRDEIAIAQRAYDETSKALRVALKNWTPEV